MCRVIIWIFVHLCLEVKSDNVKVTVKQGLLIGSREQTVFGNRLYYAFYAVPYAHPPVGNLRFKNPKYIKKWDQYVDATTVYHGTCAQAHIVHKHAMFGFEDCLNLNIYTPSLPKNNNDFLRPVLVWIHGYAFSSSFSHVYGPDFMIDNDIIFITLTHRLGAFGFSKVNETDTNSNMGLRDIVMALKWIRRNIKYFGGDKDKITVMGSDSAATFLSLLLMTKHTKMFSKMILQSGSIFSPSIFQNDQIVEIERLVKELKKNGEQSDMAWASSKEIVKASQKIYDKKDIINFQKPVVPFSPIIERESNKSLLIKRPEEFFDKSANFNINIPILIGFNSQESISEAIPFFHNPLYLKSLASFFKFIVPFTGTCRYNYTSATYNEISDKIKLKYFKNDITENSIDDFLRYTTDLRIYPVYKFITTYLEGNKNKMYVYKFNYVGKFNAVKATSTAGSSVQVKGAASGDEICYLLRCEPFIQSYVNIKNLTDDMDRKLITDMTKLWANFVKSGNPTCSTSDSAVTWLPMTANEDNILLLAKEKKIISSKSERKMFAFWNKLYDTYYSPEHCNNKKKPSINVQDEL